jgi:DNA-binding NtrC family response regulator
VPALVHELLRRASQRVKKDVTRTTADAMTALVNYRWPGNVRELENAIERAVILANGTAVTRRELPPEVTSRADDTPPGDTLDLEANERALIRRALERFNGNRQRAARALNISTVTLWRKMKTYGLGT